MYHKRNKLVHGFKVRSHPLYPTWASMKSRCLNVNSKPYPDYGGRGITVSDDWLSFENFANDMHPKPTPQHTLERIDNDAGYSKANCNWATRYEQAVNKRIYKTNLTGAKGVYAKPNGSYVAHFSHEGVKHHIAGTFKTVEEASAARAQALRLLENGFDKVAPMLERRARLDSSTGVRGISRHVDGGYVVRTTINGDRKYLGYFKNFNEAKEAIKNAKS